MTRIVLPLSDVITFQRGFDLPSSSRKKGQYPVVASTGITTTHSEAKAKGPGVVIGRSGSIGGGQYIENDYWPLNTTLWVKDFKGNNERFIYYLLKSIDFSSFNAGAAVPTLNRNHLSALKVRIPSRDEQIMIADVLGSIDEKIELNRKMKETLEQMGQALFNIYFITNPEAKKTNIGQLTNETSKKIGKDNHGDYVVLSAVKTGELVSSQDYFTKQVFSKDISKYKRISINEFAYNPARVNIGSIGMLDSDIKGAVSPVYVTFRARDDYHNAISELLKLNSTKKRIIDLCTGTVRQVLRYSDFCRVNAWEVDDATLVKFNHHYEQLDKLLKQKKAENQTLITLRDNLLPRLISGRLKL